MAPSRQEMVHAWPIHPRPMPDESLESWVVRLALSNALKPIRAKPKDITGSQLYNVDFDFIDRRKDWFDLITAGLETSIPSQLVFSRFKANLGSRWQFWVTPSQFRRYCPTCFAEDEFPYLRLIWRLNFGVVCPRHNTMLESKCGHCGSPFSIDKPNPHFSIGACRVCGSPLIGPIRKVNPDEEGMAVIRLLTALVQGDAAETGFDWIPTAGDLFDVLGYIISLQARLDGRTEGMVIGRHLSYRIQTEPHLFLNALESAWSLLHDPKELEALIRAHHLYPNKRSKTTPKRLFQYLARQRAGVIDWQTLRLVASRIAQRGEFPTYGKIAVETSLNIGRFSQDVPLEFRKHIVELKAQIRKEILSKLEAYIMSKPVCERISVHSAAKAIGVPLLRLQWMSQKDPDTRRAFTEAWSKTGRYYSSFSCRNPDCPDFLKSYGGNMKLTGIINVSVPRKAVVKCTSCSKTGEVDVSHSPLQTSI